MAEKISQHPAFPSLLASIGNAATLAERATSPDFVPTEKQDADLLAEREQRWVMSVSKGDREHFDHLHRASGKSHSAWDYLRDVRLRDPHQLPSWASAFLELIGEADFSSSRPEPTSHQRHTLHNLFVPLSHVAKKVLDQKLQDHALAWSAEARQELVDHLIKRWLRACEAGLWFECRVQHEARKQELQQRKRNETEPSQPDANSWDLHLESIAEWAELLETYPVLLRLIGVLYDHWKAVLDELLSRLDDDRSSFAEILGKTHLGKVVGCSLGAGDGHRQGRAVAILTFEGDRKIVYKPRDVGPEAFFNAVLQHFEHLAGETSSGTYAVVARDDYGWVEFVHQEPRLSTGKT